MDFSRQDSSKMDTSSGGEMSNMDTTPASSYNNFAVLPSPYSSSMPMTPGMELQNMLASPAPSQFGSSTPQHPSQAPSDKPGGLGNGSGGAGSSSSGGGAPGLGASAALVSPAPSPAPSSSAPSTPLPPPSPLETTGLVPQLQNIVSTVNLCCKLDLKKIALHARNAEYNPKRFAAVIMRIRQPRTTALIFSSGKMVCTGAKSEDESRLAARKYARIIQKLGFDARFAEFKIQNMVGSVDVRFPIRLEGLTMTHNQFSSYEPELFPGLIYRMMKPRIVLLIFVSGKVVLTGAKMRSEIYTAFEMIYPILRSFKKQ